MSVGAISSVTPNISAQQVQSLAQTLPAPVASATQQATAPTQGAKGSGHHHHHGGGSAPPSSTSGASSPQGADEATSLLDTIA